MKGINHFSADRFLEEQASATARECVFVSYSRNDKEDVLKVVKLIKDLGIDVYFDQDDLALQSADEKQEHPKVVKCIENGLDHATTLLGVITENTKDSWWVPYEIGSATGRGKPHAHLITSEVSHLPSYIKASTILPDLKSLDQWLIGHVKSKFGDVEVLVESTLRTHGVTDNSASVPPVFIHRSESELTFY